MTAPSPLVSQSARFDAEGFELVKADIRSTSQLLASSATVYLSGSDRIQIPLQGRARFWCVSDTATAGSTGIAYHILSLLRNGQSEAVVTVDTRNAEIAQYGANYLGEIQVSQDSFCRLNVAVTGVPAPTLSAANFSLRCELEPTLE